MYPLILAIGTRSFLYQEWKQVCALILADDARRHLKSDWLYARLLSEQVKIDHTFHQACRIEHVLKVTVRSWDAGQKIDSRSLWKRICVGTTHTILEHQKQFSGVCVPYRISVKTVLQFQGIFLGGWLRPCDLIAMWMVLKSHLSVEGSHGALWPLWNRPQWTRCHQILRSFYTTNRIGARSSLRLHW